MHTAEPMAAPLTPLSLCSALPAIGGRHGTYRQSFLLTPNNRQEQLSKLKAYMTYNQTKRLPLASLLALFRPVDNFCSHSDWEGSAGQRTPAYSEIMVLQIGFYQNSYWIFKPYGIPCPEQFRNKTSFPSCFHDFAPCPSFRSRLPV